ncbi:MULTISPECIES: hypothetical protein [Streptomyces]|uniref:hypothetical protein n=1 Tax=Streptomyces TaxID=1883 RepID=UPI001F0CC116|nr:MULTISPECIES: hypothetical protein [Streptomyces]
MAVAVGPGDTDRYDGGGCPEVAVVSEDLVLRPLAEEGRDLQDVGGGGDRAQPVEGQPRAISVTTR